MRGVDSPHMSAGMKPCDVEFLAGREEIEIVPFFESPVLHFIGGTYGPFRPPFPVKVPLWVALELKKRGRCRVVEPAWLAVQRLRLFLEGEKSSEVFSDIPFRYVEISSLLFARCSDNIADSEQSRLLIKEIREARTKKIAAGLRGCDGYAMWLSNISWAEVCEIRGVLCEMMGMFQWMESASGL
ncbi:MAG: GINS complex subunit Psf2 [Amphiamblys sp. WSBS2006]|nr:MAG: GINS complex subunit Psf2 [Amphiamblys sp. WSBS2006]